VHRRAVRASRCYDAGVRDVPEPAEPFPMPEIDEQGIDRTQIRRLLDLSPADRLRQLQSVLESLTRLRGGARRSPV
jgi:hypothetical protein